MARRISAEPEGCLAIVFGIQFAVLLIVILSALVEAEALGVTFLVCIVVGSIWRYANRQKKIRRREQEQHQWEQQALIQEHQRESERQPHHESEQQRQRKQEKQRSPLDVIGQAAGPKQPPQRKLFGATPVRPAGQHEQEQQRQRELEQQRRREQEEKRLLAQKLAEVDNMRPKEFEQFVGKLLKHRGYRTTVVGQAGDMGVDVIAQNEDKKYAVQVKRYSKPVSRQAVSDAVAGKEHYGCNAAMVVTNNRFTEGAKKLARSTKCQLVDRATLADWLVDLQKEPS